MLHAVQSYQIPLPVFRAVQLHPETAHSLPVVHGAIDVDVEAFKTQRW